MNETIKKIDERIDYLDLNTQLPKAELEEKLSTMHREVDELKVGNILLYSRALALLELILTALILFITSIPNDSPKLI